ncbi:hypothetical protein OG820_28830 [Streptomyces sp. NBC_00211]
MQEEGTLEAGAEQQLRGGLRIGVGAQPPPFELAAQPAGEGVAYDVGAGADLPDAFAVPGQQGGLGEERGGHGHGVGVEQRGVPGDRGEPLLHGALGVVPGEFRHERPGVRGALHEDAHEEFLLVRVVLVERGFGAAGLAGDGGHRPVGTGHRVRDGPGGREPLRGGERGPRRS